MTGKENSVSERFESLEALADKIEWEGGIAETASYGVKANEMPADHPELEKLWANLELAQGLVEDLEEKIGKIIDGHYREPI